jgi:hypothetical protein
MEDGQKRAAFYEHRWFQGTVAVVGLATAIWALVGAPKPWQVASDLSATELSLSNTEIILDASTAMGKPFGDETKLSAAQDAIAQYTVPRGEEGLSLRRVGGSCGEAGKVLVGLGVDHSEEVTDAAEEQRVGGKSNLASAVVAAIKDFSTSESLKGRTARVVVFAGGTDECEVESPTAEIKDALEGTGIKAQFRFIALKPSEEEVERLEEFEEAVARVAEVRIRTPENSAQLEQVVELEDEEDAQLDESETNAEGETTNGQEETEAEPEEEETSPEEEAEEPAPEPEPEEEEEEEAAPEASLRRPGRAMGQYVRSSSSETPPPISVSPSAPGRALITEPWPWWTTIGRHSLAQRASAAEPVASSSAMPAPGAKARARIVPAGSSIQAQA